MTPDWLAEMMEYWTPRLRLRDWTFDAQTRRAHDLGNALGRSSCSDNQRHATIRVLDPQDIDPDCLWGKDPEVTVVHELLHIVFFAFRPEPGGIDSLVLERGISAISEALVALRHEGDAK